MLLSTQVNLYAHQLLAARASSSQIQPLSVGAGLSLAEAYEVADSIAHIRIAEGEVPAGRKIAFSNRSLWGKYGLTEAVEAPIWTTLFDSTLRCADDNRGTQSLQGAIQPRLEPQIVFKLGSAPAPGATLEQMAHCIEWIAHGLEVAVCPYPGWQFNSADAVAAFGLHGTLIVGEQKRLSAASRRNLAAVLAGASVSLSCTTADTVTLCAAGFGSDVLDSPVHALLHLHRMLQQQQAAPLAAGEIIATGAMTDACPVAAGEIWSTAFSGVVLPGMTISFV